MNCENERGKERKTVWRVKRWISFNGSTSLAPLNHDVMTLRTMPMSSRLTFKGKNYFKISLFPSYLPRNYNTHMYIVISSVFHILCIYDICLWKKGLMWGNYCRLLRLWISVRSETTSETALSTLIHFKLQTIYLFID